MLLSNACGRLLWAALLFVLALPCAGQDLTAFTGRVSAVSEGDAMTVIDNANREHKIRLAGIDAPETGQEYGAAAKNFLIGLVLNQPVTVVGRRRDDDGRLVAQVFLLGRDVSYSMLWAGLAGTTKRRAATRQKKIENAIPKANGSPERTRIIFGRKQSPSRHGILERTIRSRKNRNGHLP